MIRDRQNENVLTEWTIGFYKLWRVLFTVIVLRRKCACPYAKCPLVAKYAQTELYRICYVIKGERAEEFSFSCPSATLS